eukprot:m51a1_g14483 hypothetical protein (280) ;mRNA; f:722739-723578
MQTLALARTVSWATLLLMTAQSLWGVLCPAWLYRRDCAWVVSAWRANDIGTLALACPALLLSIASQSSSSTPSSVRLHCWLGCSYYVVYNYSFYFLGAAVNEAWLLYAALFVLGLWQLILVAWLALASLPAVRLPRWVELACGLGLGAKGLVTGGVWLSGWAAMLATGSLPLPMEFFRVIAACDVAMQVFPLLASAWLLCAGNARIGVPVATAICVEGMMYMPVLMFTSPWAEAYGIPDAWEKFPMYTAMFVGFVTVGCLLLCNREDPNGDGSSKSKAN